MPATVIVGAQWGDEGKGKIVDLLAQESDLVCRYQGGPNALHTVVVGDETYKIRQIPTGVIAGKRCAIGAGCVVDLVVPIAELDELESARPRWGRGSSCFRKCPPRHALARGARRRAGAPPGAVADRHHSARDRGRPTRKRPRVSASASRTCSTRRSSARAARARRRGEERLARAGLRPRAVRRRSSRLDAARLRGAACAVCGRHVASRRRGASCRRAVPTKGRAGNAARPRSRHVPVRDVVETLSRRGPR